MKYEIYQIKDIAKVDYAYRGYDEDKFSMNDYELVYSGTITPSDIYSDEESLIIGVLEDLFFVFNCNYPNDFHGHSLSVSDVVVLDGNKYYCDRVGWKKIL